MSGLTNDELTGLHQLITERIGEFDRLASNFPAISRGLVRLLYDVFEEWQMKQDELRPDLSRLPALGDSQREPIGRATLGPEQTVVTFDASPKGFPAEPSLSTEQNGGQTSKPLRFSPQELRAMASGKPRTLAEADAFEQELSEIIEVIQGMAEDGAMPVVMAYDKDKPSHLPLWQKIVVRHGIVSWRKMAEICGLEYEHRRLSRPEQRALAEQQSGAGHVTARGSYMPSQDELIAELQRQAMAGVMPTVAFFDDAKPATWATAQAHTQRLGLGWNELAELAGLKPNPRGFKAAQPAETVN